MEFALQRLPTFSRAILRASRQENKVCRDLVGKAQLNPKKRNGNRSSLFHFHTKSCLQYFRLYLSNFYGRCGRFATSDFKKTNTNGRKANYEPSFLRYEEQDGASMLLKKPVGNVIENPDFLP